MNAQTLLTWIRVVETIAAVCTTAVPVIYAFSAWNTRTLGRLFMGQAISFATALDFTVIFTFWRARSPNIILMILLLDAIVLTAIAGSTAAMAIYILYLNRFRGKASDEVH
jgi:hypothetical protein